MVEIQVQFPEPLNDFIQTQVAAGRCASVSDYLHNLVHADQQQQRIVDQLNDDPTLTAHIDESFARGSGRRWSPAVLNELRQQVLDRERSSKGIK